MVFSGQDTDVKTSAARSAGSRSFTVSSLFYRAFVFGKGISVLAQQADHIFPGCSRHSSTGTDHVPSGRSFVVYTAQFPIFFDQYLPRESGVRYSRIPFMAMACVEIKMLESVMQRSRKNAPARSTTLSSCSMPSGAGLWTKSRKNVSTSGAGS